MSGSKSSIEYMQDKNSQLHLLMCAPEFFEVTYVINQWMQPQTWQDNPIRFKQKAVDEWQNLHKIFKSLGVAIELMLPRRNVPDMVFTANGAVVLNKRALLARFRYKERQPEEKFFAEYFESLKRSGIIETVDLLPENLFQEGAGDCIWDSQRQIFWAGYGPRSTKDAAKYIESYFGKQVIALELLSSRFYHLDLSLSPLKYGDVLYYPGAFTESSQKIIKERVPANQLISLDDEDASNFVCNLVNIDNKIVISHCSEKLKKILQERGYTVIESPVDTFTLAGGAVCCLTLKLNL